MRASTFAIHSVLPVPLLKCPHSTDGETEAWGGAVARARGSATDKQRSQGWPQTMVARAHSLVTLHVVSFNYF